MINGAIVQQKVSVPYIIITYAYYGIVVFFDVWHLQICDGRWSTEP